MQKKSDTIDKEQQQIMVMPYMPYNSVEEDEIDLRELFGVLKKRKKIIIATSILFVLLALAYIFLAKPIYSAKATIQIGKVLKKNENTGVLMSQYFDNVKNLKQYLDIKYDTSGKYRDKNATGYIKSITIGKRNASRGFLNITAYAHNNKEAIKSIQKPIDDILKQDKAYYDTIIENKKDILERLNQKFIYDKTVILPQLKQDLELLKTVELKKIDDKIKSVNLVNISALKNKIKQNEVEISKKTTAIKSMRKEILHVVKKDPALATMASMQIANLENDTANLKTKIIDLESKISILKKETIPNLIAEKRKLLEIIIPAKEAEINKMTSITLPGIQMQIKHTKMTMKEPYLVMTHIVNKIYTHNKPIKPKKRLIFVVALITGLILGIFLAFFLEFLSKEELSTDVANK